MFGHKIHVQDNQNDPRTCSLSLHTKGGRPAACSAAPAPPRPRRRRGSAPARAPVAAPRPSRGPPAAPGCPWRARAGRSRAWAVYILRSRGGPPTRDGEAARGAGATLASAANLLEHSIRRAFSPPPLPRSDIRAPRRSPFYGKPPSLSPSQSKRIAPMEPPTSSAASWSTSWSRRACRQAWVHLGGLLCGA